MWWQREAGSDRGLTLTLSTSALVLYWSIGIFKDDAMICLLLFFFIIVLLWLRSRFLDQLMRRMLWFTQVSQHGRGYVPMRPPVLKLLHSSPQRWWRRWRWGRSRRSSGRTPETAEEIQTMHRDFSSRTHPYCETQSRLMQRKQTGLTKTKPLQGGRTFLCDRCFNQLRGNWNYP